MSILSSLVSGVGDDVARAAANKGDDALRALARTDYDTLIKNAQKQIDDIGAVSLFAKDADSIAKRAKLSELRDSIKAYEHGFDNIMDYNNSVAAKAASKTPYKAPTAAYSPNIGEMALDAPVEPGKTRLFRGLENDFDPSYAPQVSDNGFGYESWTDNYDLAKQYGDNIYAVDVPNEVIANDFITPSGDRNPLIRTDKNAGLNGVSGAEYLLNVNDPLRQSLTYSRVSGNGSVLNDLLAQDNGNVFYHGTPSGGFTEFRDGSYFTPNKAYADTYQNPLASDISFGKTADNPMTYEVLLKNKAPFDITSSPEARKIYIDDYIKGGNATGINPYLSQAEYDAIQDIDWTEVEALRDFLQENGYNYDSIIADEGKHFDEAGNLIPRGRSTMVFNGTDVEILPQTLSVLSGLLKK